MRITVECTSRNQQGVCPLRMLSLHDNGASHDSRDGRDKFRLFVKTFILLSVCVNRPLYYNRWNGYLIASDPVYEQLKQIVASFTDFWC